MDKTLELKFPEKKILEIIYNDKHPVDIITPPIPKWLEDALERKLRLNDHAAFEIARHRALQEVIFGVLSRNNPGGQRVFLF